MNLQYDWDIVGHEAQLKQLEDEIAQNNIGHAYLFMGPEKIGKSTVAKLFAALLQWGHPLCGTCKECRLLKAGTHPDVTLLLDNHETLSIDQVRDLIGKANLSAQSAYRIFIVEALERMPIEAQNSFLKTLEEPPGKTLFLLTSHRPNDVLSTIFSRLRPYTFFNVDDETLKGFLEKKFGSLADLPEIVTIAQGRPGLALELIAEPEHLNDHRAMYATIERFLNKNSLAEKMTFADKLSEKEGDRIPLFFDAFTRYLRKLLFEYVEKKGPDLQSRFEVGGVVNLFESLEKTRYLMGRNVNKRLLLENFLIQTER